MAGLKVSLVTPDKDLLHGAVDQVTAPSKLGEVGILADHLPLLAGMYEGPLGMQREGNWEYYAVSGGFVEVDNNVVTILAETAERSDEIDAPRSEAALKDAEAQLKTLGAWDDGYTEQVARVKRAQIRLQVAAQARH